MDLKGIVTGAAKGFLAGGPAGAVAGGALGAFGGGGVKATADSADAALDGLSQQAIWNKVASTEKQVAIEKTNLAVQEVQTALK
jgi:hypothetical protein